MALVVGVVSVTRPTHSSLGHEWRTAAYGIVPIAGGVVFSLPALPRVVWCLSDVLCVLPPSSVGQVGVCAYCLESSSDLLALRWELSADRALINHSTLSM